MRQTNDKRRQAAGAALTMWPWSRPAPAARVPAQSEFPAGTEFVIKEFDLPLAHLPQGGGSAWINWFGGRPRPYDVSALAPGNNWPAQSYDEWAALVRDSIRG